MFFVVLKKKKSYLYKKNYIIRNYFLKNKKTHTIFVCVGKFFRKRKKFDFPEKTFVSSKIKQD
jgi:hypothetical protein